MKYIRLEWADSQKYMEEEWIKKGCILGTDNDVFVPEELLEE